VFGMISLYDKPKSGFCFLGEFVWKPIAVWHSIDSI
jgi:hypothetical protein